MKILVDELPRRANECLFVINNALDKNIVPVCKLMLSHSFDWEDGIRFSYSKDGNGCRLCFGECCPFLRKHMYD